MAALAFSFRAEAAPSEEAKKHFDAGKKLRADGDCTNAIPEFEQSLAADKSIGAYYNLGYCQAQLGRRQEAYDAYRRARDLASAKKDERLAEISGLIATLLETPHVRLVLPQPLPPGFRLEVDGETVPEALYEQETILFTKTSPTHEVWASAPGYDDVRVTLETRQLKTIDLRKTVETKGVVAPPPPPSDREGPTSEPFYRRRGFGIGLGAAGIAAVTAGVVMIVKYKVDLSTYEDRANDALRVCGDAS